MTPVEFIVKWQANIRAERSASHEHFIDLCHLLDEPTPNTDPTGATCAFEKGATKDSGRDGWADVWRRDCFAWEYKGKHKDLDAAYRQLRDYVGDLGNPPLLIVSDISRIIIRTNWNGIVTKKYEIALADFTDPANLTLLKHALSDPDQLRPDKTRAALTQDAARAFAELAKRLRERGHDPQAVAHFVNRLVFCLFADDVGLLPEKLFEKLLAVGARRPLRFADILKELFAAMAARDGHLGVDEIQWFNGGLFENDTVLPLDKDDVALLQQAAAMDWAEIDPSIFGTLFERGLDPDKRSQLGAHYTDAAKIELIIDPVIRRPLRAEWAAVRDRIAANMAERARLLTVAAADTLPGAMQADFVTAAAARARRALSKTARENAAAAKALYEEATTLLRDFLARLRAFRVLDPACGSGNFLYLSLLALKDLELEITVEAEKLGLQRETLYVGPEAVLGIEINPYAAELARVSMWIGHIQWARRHGYLAPSDPVLHPLDHIECRDAILNADGTRAEWPKADVIVGNPPFLGGKFLLSVLGDDYVGTLRKAYAGHVPPISDLVCYWLEIARHSTAVGLALRAGLVATNSVRGGTNRPVLDAISKSANIFEAWSDEPWTVEGAAVRVSVICFGTASTISKRLDGKAVAEIHSDLTSGQTDLTTAQQLQSNASVAFNGIQKTGPFEIPGAVARSWLSLPLNPNGRPNADVLRPYWNGIDVSRQARDSWIVDFGPMMTEPEAALYAVPFAYVAREVRPIRAANKLAPLRDLWWRHWRPRGELRVAIWGLKRAIATPEVTKHRVFVWLPAAVGADKNLVVIARDDDTTFGILQSRFHELWSFGLGTWLGVGNDLRYTPTTTFETFPFPEHLTPNLPAASYADNPHAEAIATAARELVEKRDAWLNPPDLVKRVPEVVPGFPVRILPVDDKAAAILKGRTLTNLYNTRGKPEGVWLDNLHRALDAAVAAAYGWPTDLSDDEILGRLLALNHARAGSKQAGG